MNLLQVVVRTWRDDVPLIILVITALFGLYKVIIKWINANSVKRLVTELQQKQRVVTADIEKLKSQVGHLTEEKQKLTQTIEKLENDFDDIIKSTLKFYQQKR